MVYCTGIEWVALFFPVTVTLTLEVPTGVVYFMPLTAALHPESVIAAPASRQIDPSIERGPRRRSPFRAPANAPSPISIAGHPIASMTRIASPPGRWAGVNEEETGAMSDQNVIVTAIGCCQ
jgi:hypothetical protein